MAAAAAETRHHATTVRGELTILYASKSCAAEAATAGLLAPVARAAPLLYRRRRPRPGAPSSDHTPTVLHHNRIRRRALALITTTVDKVVATAACLSINKAAGNRRRNYECWKIGSFHPRSWRIT